MNRAQIIETQKAIEASGADVVTVAVRLVNITDRKSENLLDYISPKTYKILPNTAGCYNVEDALRYARLARAAGISDMVKLEVIGDEKTLFPDTAGLIEATAFTKHIVRGPGATAFLDWFTCNALPKVGRINLTYALTPAGTTRTEYTIVRNGENDY